MQCLKICIYSSKQYKYPKQIIAVIFFLMLLAYNIYVVCIKLKCPLSLWSKYNILISNDYWFIKLDRKIPKFLNTSTVGGISLSQKCS